MASVTDQPAPATQPQSTSQHASTPASRIENSQDALSSSPVEMRTLAPSDAASTPAPADNAAKASEIQSTAPADVPTPLASDLGSSATAKAAPSSAAHPAPPTNLSRTETEAIGPSTDTPAANPDNTNGPVVVIMLLLTTGARHPYKIDEKYLKKRNVTVDDMDPYNISVYTLKELIWRDWREEWEPRPTSHSSIRLIHFGRMLDDKSPLKDCRFQTDSPNVVHMTVKPQDVVDEEDAKIAKGNSRRDGEEEPTAGCRCVIL